MKTLYELEQDAKEAREEAIKEVSQYVPNAIEVADKLILAAVAMVTYQFAVAENLRNGKLIELKQGEVRAFTVPDNETMTIYYFDGGGCTQENVIVKSGSGRVLPEASQDQKEVDADGWITWSGGECPVDSDVSVDYRLRSGSEWLNCKAPQE
jgi:hypothetical protein